MSGTVSVIILALIMGLGLVGASESQCRQSLNNAGYNLSDDSLKQFVSVANDPNTSYYISSHGAELQETYAEISSGDHSNLYEWYNASNIREEEFAADSIESNLVWADVPGSGSAASITVNLPSLGDSFGTTKRIYTSDGGYFYMTVDTTRVSEKYYNCIYTLYYVDPEGGESQVCSGNFMPDIDHASSYTVDFDVLKSDDNTFDCYIYRTHWNGKQTVTDTPSKYVFELLTNPDMGETVDDNSTTLPINPDGSVTLPDGTVVYPNEDGSYTIDGVTYYPDHTIPSDDDLIKWLLEQLAKDDDITVPLDPADDPAIDDAMAAAASYEGDLSEFILGSKITQVFPFCLPFDFVRGIKMLSAQPQALKISIPFEIPSFGSFSGVKESIDLNMEDYSGAFTVVRWLNTFGFILTLVMISRKIVKGA